MPVYNESRTLRTIVGRVLSSPIDLDIEIVAVDDGSKDDSVAILNELAAEDPRIRVIVQPHNMGKGKAIRTAIDHMTGDIGIIQDADLEYDPRDYVPMLQALLDGRGDIVYGSRYLGRGRHQNQSIAAYLGGRSLSLVALACTGTYLTDTVTALKLFPRELLLSLTLTTSGFELDHEITAKVLARGCRIVEVPVRYYPRSREEGKKIGLRDWFIGCRTFIRFRNG